MNKLTPLDGVVLVELGSSPFGNIPVPEKKYDSRTEGVIVALPVEKVGELQIGLKVFWEEYKDTVRAKQDDKEYAFIKIEDIRGYEAS